MASMSRLGPGQNQEPELLGFLQGHRSLSLYAILGWPPRHTIRSWIKTGEAVIWTSYDTALVPVHCNLIWNNDCKSLWMFPSSLPLMSSFDFTLSNSVRSSMSYFCNRDIKSFHGSILFCCFLPCIWQKEAAPSNQGSRINFSGSRTTANHDRQGN